MSDTVKISWQPKDEDGNPIGGPQVIEGETYEEAFEKIQHNYDELLRHVRKLKKEKIEKDKQAPEGAEKASQQVTFNPRPLTPEQKLSLVRDLYDPERIENALDTVLEAKFGAKPAEVGTAATQNAENLEALRGQQEATAWREANPDVAQQYFTVLNDTDKARVVENTSALCSWVEDRGLKFTQANLEKAFIALNDAALLRPTPSVAEIQAQVAQPETNPVSRITNEDVSATKRPLRTSGVTRQRTSTANDNTPRNTLTREMIEKMSDREYAQKLKTDPNFGKAVDKLLAKKQL